MNLIFEILISYSLYIFIGIILINISFKLSVDRKNSTKLFLLSLFIYTFFTSIKYFDFVSLGYEFISPDENDFFLISQQLGRLPNIYSIFKTCFIDKIHLENEGAHFYRGLIAYFSNNYLSGNSPLFQYLNTAFIASLTQIFLYRILNFFTPSKTSFKYTIIYIFCSYIILSAAKITRDIHITLLFTIGLSILYSSFSIKKFLILLLLMFITLQFRFEHGVFFAFIPLLYIYEKTKKNKIAHYFFIFLVSVIFVYFSTLILKNFDRIFNTLERYQEFTYNSAMRNAGLGSKLLLLPIGIKQFAIVIYSQFSPFPPWKGVSDATDIFQIIIGLVQMISPFFWFLVWYTVIRSIKNYNFRSNLPKILILSGFIFIVFLFLNSSNINPRRLVCMYPILYSIYVIACYKMPLITTKYKRQSAIFYTFLIALYLFIK